VHWNNTVLLGHIPKIETEQLEHDPSVTLSEVEKSMFGWIDDLFSIQEIGFGAKVDLMDGTSIDTHVKYTFGGSRYELSAAVNFVGLEWVGQLASKLLSAPARGVQAP
jgi:hypothetical protein